MSDLTRAMLDDIWPTDFGPIWEPEEDADLDLTLEGMSNNYEVVRAFLSTLSDIRNPNKTTILSDLEREYGIPTNTLLSEATRRARLAELEYGNDSNGTEDDLQTALRNVGFDVYVYQNDPAVDPAIFLEQAFQMVAGGDNAYAGRIDAFAGILGGKLLVNGDIFTTSRIFTSVAGSGFYAGTGHGAGEYTDLLIEKQEYPIPTDPNDWPLVFFVGGVATLGNPNLIINGGFETGDFTGWTQFLSTIDNTNPASGIWAAKLIGFSPIAIRRRGAQTKSYNVNPLNTYTIKAKNDVTTYVKGNYRNSIEFRNADDDLISEEIFLDKTAITVGYEQVVKTVGPSGSGADIVFPLGTQKIRIQHLWDNLHQGTGFMDDVEFFRSDKQSITGIDNATIDGTREDEFKRIILQYKPLHSWAALIVNFA